MPIERPANEPADWLFGSWADTIEAGCETDDCEAHHA